MMGLKRFVVGTGLGVLVGYGTLMSIPSNNLSRHLEEAHRTNVGMGDTNIEFLLEFKNTILQEAREHRIPAAYLAAVLLEENYDRPRWEDVKENVATVLGYDTTLGPGQVKISTAVKLDCDELAITRDRQEIIDRLRDPYINIKYVARFLAHRKAHTANARGLDNEGFLHNPKQMVLVGSQYVNGLRAEENWYGYSVVMNLKDVPNVFFDGESKPIVEMALNYVRQNGRDALSKF